MATKNQIADNPLPWFFIGKHLTDERINGYINNKQPLLSQALGREDTRSVWYSREHILKLLEEIDHAGGDGLRIYFGMYEATHAEFPGQTCLLMAVTRSAQKDGKTVHERVSLEDESDFAQRSSLSRDLNQPYGRDFNFGSPCPSLCD